MDNGFSITFDHHPDATEDDAGHAFVQYEDEWVATLIHDGFNWMVVTYNPHYVELTGEMNGEYSTIADFIDSMTRELEKV